MIGVVLTGAILASACTTIPSLPALPFGQQPGAVPSPAAKPQTREVPAQNVTAAVVKRGDISETLTYSGNVAARGTVNLVPKISVRVEKLNFDVGDEVHAGDVVAELEHAALDAAVLQAQAGVSVAEAKLATVRAGAKPEDVAQAQSAVDAARAKLDQVRAGPKQEDVDNLQASVDSAAGTQQTLQAQFVNARLALDDARMRFQQAQAGLGGPGVKDEDITNAAAQVDIARSRLAQVKAGPRPEDIRAAELEVIRTTAARDAAGESLEACGQGSTTTKTRTETQSKSNTKNQPASPTPTSKNRATTNTESNTTTKTSQSCSDSQQATLQGTLDVAEAQLQIALNALQKAKNGPTIFDVQQAEQTLVAAQTTLQKLKFGGTSDLPSLQLKVDQSQAEVDRLQAAMDSQTATVAGAQARLASALNPSIYDVKVAQSAVDQAAAGVAQKARPYTAEDLQAAAAGVEQAAAALQAQRVAALEATIKAPFDGVISQRLVSQGSIAALSSPIVTLVSKDVEIVLQVEEAKLGRVQKGQPASIQVSAYPDQLIDGYVQSIAPTADPKSRTFAVRVWPREQDGRLKDGMFAQVRLTSTPKSAILVPQEAIATRAGRTLVFVIQDGRARSKEVQVGVNDGSQTEIVQGLNVGDEVLTSNVDTITDGAPVQVQGGPR
ncbi:MAG: efflux RND transporter periplasmic adaptor subunit [Chloroflexi bacterium]|nr:efflux RND transporter periplasmic adaptor subunit [Chloroflexota bacterium]